jgi:hypothetical protein
MTLEVSSGVRSQQFHVESREGKTYCKIGRFISLYILDQLNLEEASGSPEGLNQTYLAGPTP